MVMVTCIWGLAVRGAVPQVQVESAAMLAHRPVPEEALLDRVALVPEAREVSQMRAWVVREESRPVDRAAKTRASAEVQEPLASAAPRPQAVGDRTRA